MNSPNEHPYDSLATAFYERRAERPSPPRNGQVDKLITDLRTLLFPECSDLRVEIRRRIDSVSDDLLQLVEQSMIANPEDNHWTVKAVHNKAEAIELGEIGFEPYLIINGVQLVRKRK